MVFAVGIVGLYAKPPFIYSLYSFSTRQSLVGQKARCHATFYGSISSISVGFTSSVLVNSSHSSSACSSCSSHSSSACSLVVLVIFLAPVL